MAGIVSYGAYVPLYRLSRKDLAQFWKKSAQQGEKAVANCDEDSLTMAVEATVDCLGPRQRDMVDALYFATVSPAYLEKQNASIIASAVDLRDEAFTADFGHSVRGATTAFVSALDAIKAGSRLHVVVAAAECRVPAPDSDFEMGFGDGAAAFLLGAQDVAVEVEWHYGFASEFMDVWRRPKDHFHRTWEDRFVTVEGFVNLTRQAITRSLERQGKTIKDFAKIVVNGPDARSHAELGRSLRIEPAQVQDPLLSVVGYAGTASASMMLVAALEEAKPGDSILWANYSDGCDVFGLRVTEHIVKARGCRGVRRHLASKRQMESYGKYIHFRNLMEWESERRAPDQSALTVLWREREQILRCYGSRCRGCEQVQYPVQRICAYCGAKDDYDLVRLSHRKGKIFTFSMDERAMAPDLPNVVAIVDLDEGGRYYAVVTDRDPQSLEVGQPVELTFRKLHEGHGINNYAWKARPVRD